MKIVHALIVLFFIINTAVFSIELTINTADTVPYSIPDDNGFYDILLKEVFRNIGIGLKINHLPSKRSLENADKGIADGEFGRIKGLSSEYKNLKLVNEPLVNFYFVAFSRNPDIKISDWDSLSDYNVAFINGWKIFENNIGSDTNIIQVNDEDSLFKMLINDRVDLILYSKLRGLSKMEKVILPDIYILDPPLSTRGMFLYLHSKYEYLIPDIETELRNIKGSGRYDEIMKEYLIFNRI
jgi:polar amino acid transport system substrate-binding protein